ncbi:MAG TPA: site-2 protease family protein, partial [Marmoricola sp.]|nr:site-2 protease family protein [Marmoricola sp.]
MTALLYILGVLAIVVGLAVSIALHECGHMVPAKKFGVRVPQFFVGFGRTLWSTHRNGTEYGVKAFPLGGFVKLIGMLPPDDLRPESERSQGAFGRLISDARQAEAELLLPGDEDRMFYRLPWWKKVIVMAGGPTVNLIIAFFLFGGVFAFHGVPETTTRVDTIAQCVIAVPAGTTARTTCRPTDAVSPAKLAGLKVGDDVVGFDHTTITSYSQLQKLIRANPKKQVTLTVLRDGKRIDLTATTKLNDLPALNGTHTVKAGYLGITPVEENVTKGAGYTLGQMGGYTKDTVAALGHLPGRLWGVAKAVVG